jgi:pyroglutamyl-peptidase
MPRILLTAFEPYDRWPDNSSWMTLVELTSWLDTSSTVITRRYPVDLQAASDRLRKDLLDHYDFAIHLGQSPGSPLIKLESTGLNLRTDGNRLIEAAPAAYHSPLPLSELCRKLREDGIPAEVSHYAGTYLCNAVLYLSQHFAAQLHLSTRSMFIHLPLCPAQVARIGESWPSCSIAMMAQAVEKSVRWVESLS